MPFTSDRFRLTGPVTKDAAGAGARMVPDDPRPGTPGHSGDLETPGTGQSRGTGPRQAEPPIPGDPGDEDSGTSGAPDLADQASTGLEKKKDPDAGEDTHPGGADRDSMPDEDFAGPGRTFPIASPGDVSDAASLAHHADDPDAVRSNIKRIARRKFPGLGLPPSVAAAKAASPDTRSLIVGGEKIMTQLTPSGLQKLMSWADQSRGEAPLPGRYQDSPGSAPGSDGPSGPVRHPQSGQFSPLANMLAQGHQAASVPGSQRLSYQQVMPGALATITTVEPERGMGPLASGIACHQGQATVQSLNQADASAPYLMTQLGPRAPSGHPLRLPFGGGQQPTPAQPLTPPSGYPSPACKSAVPGSQFTTKITSNGD
jgi:hypothetical protein